MKVGRGWIDGPVAKNTFCSYKGPVCDYKCPHGSPQLSIAPMPRDLMSSYGGPRFDSQHPCGSPQPSIISRESDVLFQPPQPQVKHEMQTYTQAKHSYSFKKKKGVAMLEL